MNWLLMITLVIMIKTGIEERGKDGRQVYLLCLKFSQCKGIV